MERVLGETVTEQDIMLHSLHSGLDTLNSLLDSHPTQQRKRITIALPSNTALKRALDTSPHGDQAESLKVLGKMSKLLDKYPATNITLVWLPRTIQLVGFHRTKQLALEAARMADLTTISKPQTINSQLKQAEIATVKSWAERYNQALRTSMAY